MVSEILWYILIGILSLYCKDNHLHCIVAPVLNLLTKAGDVDKLDEGLEDRVEVVKDTLDPVDDNLDIIFIMKSL